MNDAHGHISLDGLNALLDAAVDAIVLMNTEGLVTRFNHAAERLFGYTADQVLGRNVRMLMPAPYREEHDGYLTRYLSTGKRRIIGIGREVQGCRQDGSTFPIDLSVGEYRNGSERGFVGIIRDTSERHEREAELRRIADELRLLFDHAPTPIAVFEVEGAMQSSNPAFLNLSGYTQNNVAKLKLLELIAVEDRKHVETELDKLRDGADTAQREVHLLHRNGRKLPVLLYCACARDQSGRPTAFIVEMIDRSALHAATHEAESLRERLAHAGRLGMLGEMVSGIAHEVNQPLTAISNYANACRRMLLGGQTTQDEIIEVLQKISGQAERAGQVIRGLRSMVRRRDTQRAPLDINQLIEEVGRLAEIDLRYNLQRLVVDLEPALPSVLGDGVQIQQVLMNLIRNGLEAMRESGQGEELRVRSRASSADELEIRITDQGPGLSAEVESKLFDPFVTTKTEGMGLGLSISQSIVQAHGGELTYRRADAGGAEFMIRLPVAENESS